jgi:ATP-dependent Clp protease ATP-binding subunit ClpC
MQVLKGHFRPEFLNRIDEVIVFHALSKENIRSIVQIQLDRVVRTAAAQDIQLVMGESLIEHLTEAGYQPEFGARELKRQVRQTIETRLAKEILADALKSGDRVEVDYDKDRGEVTFNKLAPDEAKDAKAAKQAGNGSAKGNGSAAAADGRPDGEAGASDGAPAEAPPPAKKSGKKSSGAKKDAP